jgi:hypothetical protein
MLEVCERAEATTWAHLAAGAVIATFEATPEAGTVLSLRASAERLGGFLQVESAPASLRYDVPSTPGDAVLVEALRDRFDPTRTINRGRWGAML